jgi:hypothetical protein
LEKISNHINELKDEGSKSILSQKALNHYKACKKKFHKQKWYKSSKIFEPIDNDKETNEENRVGGRF